MPQKQYSRLFDLLDVNDIELDIIVNKINSTINYSSIRSMMLTLSLLLLRSTLIWLRKGKRITSERVAILEHENMILKYDVPTAVKSVDRSSYLTRDMRYVNSSDLLSVIIRILKVACSYPRLSAYEKNILSIILSPYIWGYICSRSIDPCIVKEVLFCGMNYSLEMFFLSMFLTHQNLRTKFYISSTMLNGSSAAIANTVILNNRWQLQMDSKKRFFICDHFTVEEIAYPSLSKKACEYPSRRNNIAFYSDGMYQRLKRKKTFHRQGVLNDLLDAENQLIDLVHHYASSHSNLSFMIFIHPYAEDITSAQVRYDRLLKLPNVSLNTHGRSCESYDRYEIGIASISSTILERLASGHKALFVYGGSIVDCYRETSLSRIILEGDVSEVIERIEHFRAMDQDEFSSLIDPTATCQF